MSEHKRQFSDIERERWKAFFESLVPDVDPRALRLMDQMRTVGRNLYHIGELSVAATGLSYAKVRLLMGLLFAEEEEGCDNGLNPSEISERQGTSRNTISALVRDLEEEGLIERTLDPNDRRRFNIKLTQAGRALMHDHVQGHMHIVADCFDALSVEEQEALSMLLGKLNEQVRATHRSLSYETIGE